MKKKSSLYEGCGSGGEIPHTGIVQKVMSKYDNRTLKDQAGHTIINSKEAVMDAFNQALKSPKKLLNQNGKKGIDVSDEAEEMFRNF